MGSGTLKLTIRLTLKLLIAPPPDDLSAEDQCQLHDKELGRLRKLGLHVITFARIPFNEERKVMMITPWIDDIEDATTEQWRVHTEPVVSRYYEGWLRAQRFKVTRSHRPYHAVDIYWSDQYSTLTDEDHPFLHDLDPHLSKNEEALRRNFG